MAGRAQLHVGLFVATCATTFVAHWAFFPVPGDSSDQVTAAALYAFVVMAILTAHELGHYFMARAHGVEASWPYFIPLPFSFGTLGAVIRLKGRIPTKNALVDIGAAGPLAGLLIAVPMLVLGVSLSSVERLPFEPTSPLPPTYSLLNLASLAGQWGRSQLFGAPLPQLPAYQTFGDNLLTWLSVRLVKGELPAGSDVIAHPVFLAAWFGMVMTMLNLLPVGQLDGGHLTHAWYGEKAEAIGRRVAVGALLMAFFFSASWLMWFFLVTRFVGTGHPPVEQPHVPLSRGRKVVVLVTWLMTALTFMPAPMG
jgi:membrane-associated protease RseP (regulator of RpoE activity)